MPDLTADEIPRALTLEGGPLDGLALDGVPEGRSYWYRTDTGQDIVIDRDGEQLDATTWTPKEPPALPEGDSGSVIPMPPGRVADCERRLRA
jgi:hypothetical protein